MTGDRAYMKAHMPQGSGQSVPTLRSRFIASDESRGFDPAATQRRRLEHALRDDDRVFTPTRRNYD